VPSVELPPATPFTVQLTLVFELPVTVAVNCWELAARTFGVLGVTITVIFAGPDPLKPSLAQPAATHPRARMHRDEARKCFIVGAPVGLGI
jgi:hypothetical protein